MSPTIIAHRGASGYEPENSRAAFQRAAALGADGVELDVHATRDGVLLVHHDAELPGHGPIGELAAAEAATARLPNGETVPSLAEALETIGALEVWIEIKTLPQQFDDSLLATMDAGPARDRYGVHAFDHRIIARLGARRPALRRGVLLASYLVDTLAVLRDTGATTLWQESHLIDEALVRMLHGAGHRIIAWTVSSDAEVARLTNLGVDGLCGNFPDRLRAALPKALRR